MGSLICFSVIGTMNSWFKFLEFTPCLKSQLWVLGVLWLRQPASSWGLQHASYQLALRENLLLLIFLPFLPPWYASLQFFFVLFFNVVLISCCCYFGLEPVFTSKERKRYSKRLPQCFILKSNQCSAWSIWILCLRPQKTLQKQLMLLHLCADLSL